VFRLSSVVSVRESEVRFVGPSSVVSVWGIRGICQSQLYRERPREFEASFRQSQLYRERPWEFEVSVLSMDLAEDVMSYEVRCN
jgi:hypothetical protein